MKAKTGTGITAIYTRISHDATGEGLGVERQEAACRKLIGRGATVQVYSDNDISAFSGARRPAYEALKNDIEAGVVTHVVAWAADRLYRRQRDLTDLTELLRGSGVVVQTVTGGFIDLSSAEGIFQASIVGAAGEFESARKGERVAASKKQAAERGLFLSTAVVYGWMRGEIVGTWEPDPVDSVVVQEAFQMVLEGSSLGALSRVMKQRHGVSKATPTWRNCLMSPRHAGLVQYRGEIVAEAADGQSLVSRDDWERVRVLLTDPARRTTKGRSPQRLLSGLALCGRCLDDGVERTMVSSQRRAYGTTNREYVALMCRPDPRSNHVHLTRNYDQILDPVLEVFLAYVEQELPRLLTLPQEEEGGERAEPSQRAQELEGRIAAAKAMEGVLTADDIRRVVVPLEAELAAERAAGAGVRRSSAVARMAGGGGVRQTWSQMSIDEQRAAMAEVMRIVVKSPKVKGHPSPDDVEVEFLR